jgi:hypothetical protein
LLGVPTQQNRAPTLGGAALAADRAVRRVA